MASTINASTTTGIVQSADTSGNLALQSAGTTKFTVASTGAYGQLVSGTAVASTSGTSIDFTSIPSWVKRITVMFSGVSTNFAGAANIALQLGTSGGIQATGYAGSSGYFLNAGASGVSNNTNGLLINMTTGVMTFSGIITFALLDSSNGTWVGSYTLGRNDGATVHGGGTTKTLSGTLDKVRITTTNGTDTFDAGSINILYEG